jgi:hypothetical protein
MNLHVLPHLADWRQRCDPLADEALAAITHAARPGTPLLERVREAAALGVPQARAFIEGCASLGDLERDTRLGPGRTLALRHAPLTFLILVTGSLVESFASWRGAQVLSATGRLERDTYPRIIETAELLVELLQPGSLHPGGRAHEKILRVRLLHAAVRRFVRERGFDEATLGAPVNQLDMVHTQLMFSHALLRGLDQLGASMRPDEEEAFASLWRAVGLLMGVDPELCPDSRAQERALYDAIIPLQYAPHPASVALASATLASLVGRAPYFLPAASIAAVSRRVLGEALADSFSLPEHPAHSRAVAMFAAAYRRVDRARPRLPSADRALGALFLDVNLRWAMRERVPATYRLKQS